MFSNMPILELTKKLMHHSALKQRVLSQNITNANTPNFHAMITEEFNEKNLSHNRRKLQTLKTSNAHFEAKGKSDEFRVIYDKSATNFSPDGNNVDIAAQSFNVSIASSEHRIATATYDSFTKLIKAALGEK